MTDKAYAYSCTTSMIDNNETDTSESLVDTGQTEQTELHGTADPCLSAGRPVLKHGHDWLMTCTG